MVEMSKVFGGC